MSGERGQPGTVTGSPLADLARWSQRLAALPKPISYIVLDPGWRGPHRDAVDSRGKRYVLASAAIRDEMRHVRFVAISAPIFGIPVYRRQDMPEGWPWAWWS